MPGIDVDRPRRKMSASESGLIEDQPKKSNKHIYVAIGLVVTIAAILIIAVVVA